MGLKEMEKKQNRLHKAVLLNSVDEVMFCDYLSVHPRLYEGCELDTGTIDFINQHFYYYSVNPTTFEQYFITKLKHVSAQYNNMKRIEFNELVFDVCTSKYVRHLVTETTKELARTGGKSATTKNTGTVKDDKDTTAEQTGQTTYGKTETNTVTKAYETDTEGTNEVEAKDSNKQAQRNMTMLTQDADPKQTFDWSKGASGIAEASNDKNSTTTIEQHDSTEETDTEEARAGGSDSNNSHISGNEVNERTLNTQIKYDDVQTLNDLGNDSGEDTETLDITEGQGVDLIAKIWNYLEAPKSLDFLIDKLSTCFILVY